MLVYTTAASDAEALSIAGSEMADADWIVISVEAQYRLTRAAALEAPGSLEFYEQALLDGVVLVFHEYPHGGEEPDVLH